MVAGRDALAQAACREQLTNARQSVAAAENQFDEIQKFYDTFTTPVANQFGSILGQFALGGISYNDSLRSWSSSEKEEHATYGVKILSPLGTANDVNRFAGSFKLALERGDVLQALLLVKNQANAFDTLNAVQGLSPFGSEYALDHFQQTAELTTTLHRLESALELLVVYRDAQENLQAMATDAHRSFSAWAIALSALRVARPGKANQPQVWAARLSS